MLMKSLQLSQIWIYPVKSLSGISLQSARVHPKGLAYDRRWMLIDGHGNCMTQRKYPHMARFKISLDADILTTHYERDQIIIPLSPIPKMLPLRAQIWDDIIEVQEVSPLISKWFTERLGNICQLVYFPEKNLRPVEAPYAINNDQVNLADSLPFLIVGQGSLDDLNDRLDVAVPINRFRPNLVFTGGKPYEEDFWGEFTIGENRFLGVKPCARCVLTTVNHETGEKGIEPLKTLATYRKRDGKIFFGQNVIALEYKHIHVGDIIKTGS